VEEASRAVQRCLEGTARVRSVTMAEARLNDGQRLLAFNDLFVGARSHISARYRIRFGNREEPQSSSGIIVSTGAGSTGWLSSVLHMAAGVMRFAGSRVEEPLVEMRWEDERLVFVVREPFKSRTSRIELVAGYIAAAEPLVVESRMPNAGVIFSDGIETDFLNFNAGAIARIGVAGPRAHLVVR